jgi:hypothetical protein
MAHHNELSQQLNELDCRIEEARCTRHGFALEELRAILATVDFSRTETVESSHRRAAMRSTRGARSGRRDASAKGSRQENLSNTDLKQAQILFK